LASRNRKKNKYRSPQGEGKKGRGLLPFLARICRIGLAGLAFAGVSVALLAGYHWMTHSDYFAVQDIEIEGNRRVQESEIASVAEVHRGRNTLDLSISRIESRLSRDPWLRSVSVRRVLPDKLRIRVRERTPCFIKAKGDRLYYADAAGRAIAPVQAEGFESLPQLSMPKKSERNKRTLEELLRLVSGGRLPFGSSQVAWIHLHSGEIVTIFLQDEALLIKLGTGNLQGNCRALGAVWSDLLERGELGSANRIAVYKRMAWVQYGPAVHRSLRAEK
jgi:cell division protein FtsQ